MTKPDYKWLEELNGTETRIVDGSRRKKGRKLQATIAHLSDILDREYSKKSRCPHGRIIDGEYMPAFAGGISTCKCCQNWFGHFGNPPKTCPECS